jgi:hypothetical protein
MDISHVALIGIAICVLYMCLRNDEIEKFTIRTVKLLIFR